MQNPETNRLAQIQDTMKRTFEKRYKYRSSSRGHDLAESEKNKSRNYSDFQPESNKNRANKSLLESNQLGKTLEQINFSHHSQLECLCKECNCGRHLCKLHVIKPDMKKSTAYQQAFLPKYSQRPVILKIKPYDKLKGDHLNLNTEYLKQFTDRLKQKIERPHPSDKLKFQGPSQSITSYGQFYIGHHGQNQYVKPTNKHTRAEFPLMASTTYNKHFLNKKYSKQGNLRHPDHLRTGSNWFGKSTYNQFYKEPNPEDYSHSLQIPVEKHYCPEDTSKTQYKKNFVQLKQAICPAKLAIKQKSEHYETNKHSFLQNSDFKAMSPNFQAISTSKHFYV